MVRSERRDYSSETEITGDDQLRKGDHVYVWKPKGRFSRRYTQHGIYVGVGKIVCFTDPKRSSSSSSSSFSCSSSTSSFSCSCSSSSSSCSCSSSSPANSERSGLVRKLKLKSFQGESSLLYRYEYGVSEIYFKNRRAGTCTTATTVDSGDTVCGRAEYLLEHNGYGRYDWFKHNCEDFALYCRTGLVVNGGKGGSSQAVIFPNIFKPVGWKALKNRWFGDGVVFDDEYRYQYDIGFRKDKKKIEVRDLVRLLQGPGNSNRPPTAIRIVEQRPRASSPDKSVDEGEQVMKQHLEKLERILRGIEDAQETILEEINCGPFYDANSTVLDTSETRDEDFEDGTKNEDFEDGTKNEDFEDGTKN